MTKLNGIPSAPKDCQVIIAIYADFSGAEIVRFGEDFNSVDGWFNFDYSDKISEDLSEFIGWIPMPEVSVGMIGDSKMKKAKER
jgi:hypothetical protein